MPKQSRKKPAQEARRDRARRKAPYARLMEFPQARGQTVE